MSENLTVNPNSAPCGCGRPMLLNAASHGCERWYCGWCCLYFIRETPKPGYTNPDWSTGSNFDVHCANMKPIARLPAAVTTCARCSATIDPAAVEQHHERCFVAGDWVRWDGEMTDGSKSYRWLEGVILEIDSTSDRINTHVRITARSDDGFAESVYLLGRVYRHIQRPGQAVRSCCPGASTGHACGCDPIEARATAYHKLVTEAPGPIGCAHDDDDELQDAMEQFTPILPPEVDPLDVVYDGVPLRTLLRDDEMARRENRAAMARCRSGTVSQRAAVSAHWSQQLKQRISAAKERERFRVTYCEVDVDD